MLISNSLNLTDAYKTVDEMFNGWFREHYTFDEITTNFFTDVATWTPIDLFAGMSWLFLNYPMAFIIERNPDVKGQKMFNSLNLAKVDCILDEAGYSKRKRTEILRKLIKENQQMLTRGTTIEDIIQHPEIRKVNVDKEIVTKWPDHPFKRAIVLLEKRRLLPDNILELDKEMQIQLGLGITYLNEKIEVALGQQQERLEAREKEIYEMNRKKLAREQLLDRAPSVFSALSSIFSDTSSTDSTIFVPYKSSFWGY